MRNLERLYIEAKSLEGEAGILVDDLSRHIEKKGRKSLIKIAAGLKTLGWRFNNLGIDTIKLHEKKQKSDEDKSNG